MTPKDSLCVLYVAVVLQFGVLAGSAQTGTYLFTGSETNITLNPGTYDITAFGAKGGSFEPSAANRPGGLGAEMSAEFNFSAPTTLVLLVGGSGGTGVYYGGGGGGGSIIDSSAIMVLAEISGVASPDDSPNGEIIITAVPGPSTLTYQVINGELVLNWVQGTLLSAGTVNGTYTPVSGATSPYTNSMTVAQQYFRVLVGADATLKAGPGWTVPNQAHAANTAMKTLFHAVGQWRDVADRHR